MISTIILYVKVVGYTLRYLTEIGLRSLRAKSVRRQYNRLKAASAKSESDHLGPEDKDTNVDNIVIIGASFAGYHAAKILAESLPASSPYRIVVVEPNSHFQFTWLLPRFSVMSGYESKLFIPYGPYLKYNSDRVQWMCDRVVSISKNEVCLRDSQAPISWKFLVIATGSGQTNGLPSRVGCEDKDEGILRLKQLQTDIRNAQDIVIVGGGAAGVELAADAKESYPDKKVTLVHSRQAPMHRFEAGLQIAAREALTALQVNLVLNDRVIESSDGYCSLMHSKTKLKCDLLVDCVGQKPTSSLVADIAPNVVAKSGHIKVKPTLQIAEETLPHIYVCGDVADVEINKPNARAAMMQAAIVADNIVLAVQGKQPLRTYKTHWIEGVIKLTLGLHKSVTHFCDGQREALWHSTEKKITLMADQTWSAMGVRSEASES